MAQIGRRLDGDADAVTGFTLSQFTIEDPKERQEVGLDAYPVLRPTQEPSGTVTGTVYRLTLNELSAADDYEGEHYRRVHVSLASGRSAWVYIAA